jgi:Zn-dependent protease
MREPFSWSFPLMRLFGITVRVHWLFPMVFVGLVGRAAFKAGLIPGTWIDMAMILGLMFVSVLLHEFGHCFGARWVDGDAQEVLLWPLGGLAYVEVPHTARANFITTLAGPLVNLGLCAVCAVGLLAFCEPSFRPPLDPFSWPQRVHESGIINLKTWGGEVQPVSSLGVIVLARFFWVNWVLALLNLVLIGFPMDGGRLFQCLLWPRYGYRQATLFALVAGFITAIVVGVVSIVWEEVLLLCLALFIFVTCWQKRIMLETGGEESLFGYDFSQGYTSLEREQEQTPAPRRKQSWWQRFQQRRATKKMLREQEVREAEERRMDELLEKVQRLGLGALTKEEQTFLKRVSDRYRNRH